MFTYKVSSTEAWHGHKREWPPTDISPVKFSALYSVKSFADETIETGEIPRRHTHALPPKKIK